MTLYLVSTPIGNLEDLTLRAIRVLKESDFVIAEDTRITKKILNHLDIKKETISFHSHSNERKKNIIIERLKNGESASLCTDAGSPGISDPGYELISSAIENDVDIIPLPGPTALIPALQLSGLPIARFIFAGFPPAKKGREKFFSTLSKQINTAVIYESPHRLQKTLEQLAKHFGQDRKASISKELTKIYETTWRDTLDNLQEHFKEEKPRGEFVIVIEGKRGKQISSE